MCSFSRSTRACRCPRGIRTTPRPKDPCFRSKRRPESITCRRTASWTRKNGSKSSARLAECCRLRTSSVRALCSYPFRVIAFYKEQCVLQFSLATAKGRAKKTPHKTRACTYLFPNASPVHLTTIRYLKFPGRNRIFKNAIQRRFIFCSRTTWRPTKIGTEACYLTIFIVTTFSALTSTPSTTKEQLR